MWGHQVAFTSLPHSTLTLGLKSCLGERTLSMVDLGRHVLVYGVSANFQFCLYAPLSILGLSSLGRHVASYLRARTLLDLGLKPQRQTLAF